MNENMKNSEVYGSALGPDWSLNIPIKGAASVNYSDLIQSIPCYVSSDGDYIKEISRCFGRVQM
jgi:hypothetical protein